MKASTVKKSTVKTSSASAAVTKAKVETPVAPVVTKAKTEAAVCKTACSKEDIQKKIAEKAYQLYVERGYENGHDAEDWAKAEKIVKGS